MADAEEDVEAVPPGQRCRAPEAPRSALSGPPNHGAGRGQRG
jgi:hypothetical protein